MSLRITHDGIGWSNADEDRIELSPYDASWPARFEAEADAIRKALAGGFSYTVHHVGSTAIPGIYAKPVIDMILAIPDRNRWPSLIEPLERLGYVYWAENPNPDTMFFVKGMLPLGSGRTHHIHVHTPEAAAPALRFRDYLAAHPAAAKAYEVLKRKLGVQFATDRDAYTKGKAEFVDEILRKVDQEHDAV
jgi:GrpB-like predicted nucleotidyltransferase (UPF0157 family)